MPDAKSHSSRSTRRSENEAEGAVSSRAARLQCPKSCRKELGIASRDSESFFSPVVHALARAPLRASRSSPSSGLAGPGPEIKEKSAKLKNKDLLLFGRRRLERRSEKTEIARPKFQCYLMLFAIGGR